MTKMLRVLAAGLLAAGALGAAGGAQARDVYWSVGVGVPGVAVGVGAPQPYYAPAPVYMPPPPVYYRPRPVYVAPPPVVYGPPPGAYGPPPVYYGGGWRDRDDWRRYRRWHHRDRDRDWDD